MCVDTPLAQYGAPGSAAVSKNYCNIHQTFERVVSAFPRRQERKGILMLSPFSLHKFLDCDDCVLKKMMHDMNELTFTLV